MQTLLFLSTARRHQNSIVSNKTVHNPSFSFNAWVTMQFEWPSEARGGRGGCFSVALFPIPPSSAPRSRVCVKKKNKVAVSSLCWKVNGPKQLSMPARTNLFCLVILFIYLNKHFYSKYPIQHSLVWKDSCIYVAFILITKTVYIYITYTLLYSYLIRGVKRKSLSGFLRSWREQF